MKVLLMALTIFVLCGCKNHYEDIPLVNVNIYINIQSPDFQNLSGLGSWSYIDGGSKGIIVFNVDNENYLAYERHCPYDPENSCAKVSVDETNLYAVDTCCSSRYQLLDGIPIDGPGTIPLKAYNTSFDGNIIRIWN